MTMPSLNQGYRKINRSLAETKMGILPRFILRIVSSMVSGSYFAFSTLALIFGIYFAELATFAISLPVIWILPIVWIPACVLLSVVRGVKEENRDMKHRLHLERLLYNRQYELNQWNRKLEEVPANLLTKPTKSATRLWNTARTLLEYIRTFATGLRDSARSSLSILTLTGLVMSGATLFTLNPLFFSLVIGICSTLAVAAVTDAILRRNHQKHRKDLTATIIAIEAEIASRQASQLPILPPQNQAMAKVESQLDCILSQKSNPHRNSYSTKRKITNASKYVVKLFTGSVNGGYFGFTVFVLAFGIIFPGAWISGMLAVGIASATLALTLAILYSAENMHREHRDQKDEKMMINELHYNRKKLDALKRLAKQYHFDIPPNPDYLARNKPKLPSELRPTIFQTIQSTISQGLNRTREFFRGAKNSTKLLISITTLVGTLAVSSALFTTSFPAFIIFGSFSLVFGIACAIDYQITFPRARKIEALREENWEVQRDITYYTQEIRQLNRTQGPRLNEGKPMKTPFAKSALTIDPILSSKTDVSKTTQVTTTATSRFSFLKFPKKPLATSSTIDLDASSANSRSNASYLKEIQDKCPPKSGKP